MAQEAHLQQSTEGASSNFVMAQKESKRLPQLERPQMETPCQSAQEGTHHCREDNNKQVPHRDFVDPMCLQRRKEETEKQSRVHGEVQVIRLVYGPW